MACRIDLAEIFGDETIEVVDLGSKDVGSLDTTIECPPETCMNICEKRSPDADSSQSNEMEVVVENEVLVLPENRQPTIESACASLHSPDGTCSSKTDSCPQNDVCSQIDSWAEREADICSPILIHHVGQKAQAENRKAELEELRQLSLAKQNAAKLGDAPAPAEMAEFFDKQREMSLEHRKNQRDAMEFLHKYRSDGQRELGEIRRCASRDGDLRVNDEPHPSPAKEVVETDTELRHHQLHDLGVVGRSMSKDSQRDKEQLETPLEEVTEADLELQRKQLLQQSMDRIKRYENLHSYRAQEGLIECSSGESGIIAQKKALNKESLLDNKVLTPKLDSPRSAPPTIAEVECPINDEKPEEKDSERPENQSETNVAETERSQTPDTKKVESVRSENHTGFLPVPEVDKEDESMQARREQGDTPRSEVSVEELVSTFLSTEENAASANNGTEDKHTDSLILSSDTMQPKLEIAQSKDNDKTFIGCQFGCMEIRLDLNHAYADVKRLTNVLSTPKNSSKNAVDADNELSPRGTSNDLLGAGTEPLPNMTAKVVTELPLTSTSKGAVDADKDDLDKELLSLQPTREATFAGEKEWESVSETGKDQELLSERTGAQILGESSPTSSTPSNRSSGEPTTGETNSSKGCDEVLTPKPEETKRESTDHKTEVGTDCEPAARTDAPEQLSPEKGDRRLSDSSLSKVSSPSAGHTGGTTSVKTKGQSESVVKDTTPSLPLSKAPKTAEHRRAERVSRLVAPKFKSPVGTKKPSHVPSLLTKPNYGSSRIPSASPTNSNASSPRNVILTRVPLYVRTAARKKPEKGPMCSLKYVPQLHQHRAACERCLYWASDEEKQKFESTGYHLRIMKCRGGCDRDCAVFPREKNEHPVRLCKKCFFDTHLIPKREDEESSNPFS